MRHLRQCCWLLLVLAVSIGVASPAATAGPERPTPNCVGLSRAEVGAWLEQIGWRTEWRSAGLAPTPQQQGRVAFQTPAAGEAAPAGTAVILWLYDGAASPAVAPRGSAPPLAAVADCSRWPGSVVDPASGSCRCPEGQWWRPGGEGCATREEAAALFCSRMWAGSVPAWSASGDFHCGCPPESFWDAEAGACGGPHPEPAADCAERWPGTVPVFSPGATAYECRCADGARWEESRRRCQPAVDANASPIMVPAPPGDPSANPPPATLGPQAPRRDDDDGAWPAAPPPPASGAAAGGGDSDCEGLLAEIRGRARAGQTSEADTLALRAATRGCDPGAVSDAVRGGAGSTGAPTPAPAAPAPRQPPAMRY
ncbi:MAG: PASTA domain-containing protein [Deltaproteobacteria bacterium]|nr:PASTA domain-containing protein [Deltaproteobacteria bacterium]